MKRVIGSVGHVHVAPLSVAMLCGVLSSVNPGGPPWLEFDDHTDPNPMAVDLAFPGGRRYLDPMQALRTD